MTSVIILIAISLLQCITGAGVLTLCRIFPRPGYFFPLALICGVAVFSLVPFLLQLCYIPITGTTVFVSLGIACCLLNIKFSVTINYLRSLVKNVRFTLRVYELPCLLVIGALLFISAWRCFYFPPTPRDFISGAEVIAEYTIREETMLNSLFTVNLESTNNPFKSPWLTSLQVIYKLAGFSFGQLWMSTVFISFIIFLYHALCKTLHQLIAGVLVVFFLAIPEMYAYSFMVLYDYSNAVFFFLAAWFLFEYIENRQINYLVFTGLLMGIATYIRSETLLLAGLLLLLPAWQVLKSKKRIAETIKACLIFIGPSVLFYIVSVPVYLEYYLPVKYHVSELITTQLTDLGSLFNRFVLINRQLIFSKAGITFYGYFIFIFLLVLLTEIVFKRNLSSNWLFAILVIYLGYALLGHLIPLLDIIHSTKRGFFKLFPLMLLYIANTSWLRQWSDRITKWETS